MAPTTISTAEGDVHILHSGEIYLSLTEFPALGTGGFKIALRGVAFDRRGRVKDQLAILRRRPDLPFAGSLQDEILVEWQAYSALEKYRTERGLRGHIGLADAELVTLHDGTYALIQPRYEGDLTAPPFQSIDTATVRQLVVGVQHLHRAGFVHSDIKEANAFFRHTKSGALEVVLSDYGLLRTAGTAHRGGAHGYMPPEVRQYYLPPFSTATRDGTFKEDIYALGMMFLPWIGIPAPEDKMNACYNLEFLSPPYWECMGTLARELHGTITRRIPAACLPTRLCREAIVADCLDPDPAHRLLAESLMERVNAVSKAERALPSSPPGSPPHPPLGSPPR